MAEVDVEVHEGTIFFQEEEIGNVEVGVGEKVELALKIEVEETFDGGVGSDDGGVEADVLGMLLVLSPIFVAAARRAGNRNGKARPGSALDFGMKDSVGEQFGSESGEILAIVFVESETEADAFDSDLDALVGIVAKGHSDREDAGGVGRFPGES